MSLIDVLTVACVLTMDGEFTVALLNPVTLELSPSERVDPDDSSLVDFLSCLIAESDAFGGVFCMSKFGEFTAVSADAATMLNHAAVPRVIRDHARTAFMSGTFMRSGLQPSTATALRVAQRHTLDVKSLHGIMAQVSPSVTTSAPQAIGHSDAVKTGHTTFKVSSARELFALMRANDDFAMALFTVGEGGFVRKLGDKIGSAETHVLGITIESNPIWRIALRGALAHVPGKGKTAFRRLSRSDAERVVAYLETPAVRAITRQITLKYIKIAERRLASKPNASVEAGVAACLIGWVGAWNANSQERTKERMKYIKRGSIPYWNTSDRFAASIYSNDWRTFPGAMQP